MDTQTAIDILLKLVAITVAFTVVLLVVAYTVLAERRVSGQEQQRRQQLFIREKYEVHHVAWILVQKVPSSSQSRLFISFC